jgi:hypothetical protein
MERKPFEFKVGGREITTELGNIACVLFRTQQEVQHFHVLTDEDEQLEIYNNPETTEWLAGYRITQKKGRLQRVPTFMPYEIAGEVKKRSFREIFGWNPVVIEKEEPSAEELESFLDINAGRIDMEWEEFGEEK